ncbi:MAG TPA: biotin/lipoyl-binding protein, partial [Pirellulales bacterium]
MARAAGLTLVGIALGCLAIWAYAYWPALKRGGSPRRSAANAAPTETTKRSVFALGTLEPRDGPVLVSSPLAGYQIRRLLVREGQSVKAGDTLVELDPAVAEHELNMAEAEKASAVEQQQTQIELAQQRVEAADLAVRQTTDARELEMSAQRKHVEVAELKAKQAQ